MNKPKIIFLSPVGFFKGGAERSLFDLISNPNIEPVLAVPEKGEIEDKAKEMGITCHVLPFGKINDIRRPFSFLQGVQTLKTLLQVALKLKKLAREEKTKIVHSNGLKAHIINCVSQWLGGAKSVLHIRDIPYTSAEKFVWRIMYMMCNHMILVSHACWPMGSLPKKASVIHNGTPLIENLNDTPANHILTIGFVGRIHPAKGLHLLIEWAARAKAQDVNFNISVRGSFSDDAPAYKAEMQTLIEQHDLSEHIEFTGFIDNAKKLYAGLDIVVVPSQIPDPLPRSVMEAMARGIPVFGYPAGGIFEMIEDKKTGYLVKNEKQFISALQDIQNNPKRFEQITKAAKDKITREFTIENLHTKIFELYQK